MEPTIVVIHPGALGDVFLAVPALRWLRQKYSPIQFCLCANEQAARLLGACGEIDRWMSIENAECSGLFGGGLFDSAALSQWLSRCDLLVAWLRDADGTLASSATTNGARRVLVGSPFSSGMTATHQRDRFLEAIGESPDDLLPPALLSLPDQARLQARDRLCEAGVPRRRNPVLVHPGSGSLHKCVEPAILAAVVDGLMSDGAMPILVEGPADRPAVENLLRKTLVAPPVLRSLDLISLAGVLAEGRLFLGHDSGVTHLSALLGTPTVALFGPTDPERWAPAGRHVRIMRGAVCACRGQQAVSRCQERPCLSYSAEDVLRTCRALLGTA